MIRIRFAIIASVISYPFFSAPALASTKCETNISPSIEYFKLGDGTADGTQVLVPGTISCSDGPLDLSLRTAYVTVNVNSADPTQNGTLHGLTDTTLSASYNVKRRKGGSLRFSLDANAPTGLTSLNGREQNALVDADLVDFARYGEGWNVGGALNGAAAIDRHWTITAGGGYVFKGPYRPFAGNPEIEPGGIWTANLGGVYSSGGLLSKLNLSAYDQDETRSAGTRIFRPGTLLTIEWYNQKQVAKSLSVFGSFTYSHSWSGARYTPTISGSTVSAPIQSGDTLAFSLGGQKQLSRTASFGLRASYINRGAETVDPSLLDFLPKRDIYVFGAFAEKRVSPRLNLSANLNGKLLYDQASSLFSRQSYQVVAFDIRITRRFK